MLSSLVEVLLSQVSNRPDSLAFAYLRDGLHLDQQYTYADLDKRARTLAAVLQKRGMHGNRVLLLYPSGFESICAFLGCLYAGAIAVPAPPPVPSRLKRTLPRLTSIIDDCDASMVLTESRAQLDSEIQNSLRQNSKLEWLATDEIAVDFSSEFDAQEIHSDELAYLQYTSGSIGEPKGIEISHFNLVYQLAYLQDACCYSDDSITVTWMPNFHDWGLVEGLFEPLFNGTPCYILSPISFLKRPRYWLAAISKYRATHSQGPTFAYEHCVRRIKADDVENLDISSWRSAGIAAEHVNFHVMQDFYQKFSKAGFCWETFSPVFGLGEATLLMSVTPIEEPPTTVILDSNELENDEAIVVAGENDNSRVWVSSGIAHGETRIAIVHPVTNDELDDGRIGEIWVNDPAVAKGYWNREADSKYTFRAKLANGTGPFMRTGDLGFMRDGHLFVTGRLKDLIIIRGSNHYPQDIEWTAQGTHPALQGQTGAAFSMVASGHEQLVLLQEVDNKQILKIDFNEIMSSIAIKVGDEHEVELSDLLLLRRGTIPKTASGKIKRVGSKQLYLDDGFEPLARLKKTSQVKSNRNSVNAAVARPAAIEPPNSSLESVTKTQSDRKTEATRIIDWLREYASSRINSQIMDQRRSVSPHVILDFGNQGLFGMQVPKSFGGLDLGWAQSVRVLEQLAAIDSSLATLVFLSNTNGLRPIIKYASAEIQRLLLPELAAGRRLAAFALSEPVAGANIGAIQTKAVAIGDRGWQLSGHKRWNASSWADVITVVAREVDSDGVGQGVSAFLVRQGDKGLRVGEESLTMGMRSIVQNALHLDEVPVEKERLLGKAGGGWEVVNDALTLGRLCTAAVCLGGMKRALQLMFRYASNRSISTGLLVDHPNVHRHLAEQTANIEAVEIATKQLAFQLDLGAEPNQLLMMVVKIAASEYFNDCTAVALQTMGGRGYMENNEVSRLFRDARALSIGEGPNESLLGFIGQPQNEQGVVDILNQFGSSHRVELLRETTEKIRSLCSKRSDMPESSRRFWAHQLIGIVSSETILLSLVEQAEPSANPDTINWLQQRHQQIVKTALENALGGANSRPMNTIKNQVAGYETEIGNIWQNLPGEDQAVDPMLRMNTRPTARAQNTPSMLAQKSSQLDSLAEEKRKLLKKLLTERSTTKDNETKERPSK